MVLFFLYRASEKEATNGQSEPIKQSENNKELTEEVEVEKDTVGPIDLESLDYEAMEAAHSDNEAETKVDVKEVEHSQQRVESKEDNDESDDSSGKGILIFLLFNSFSF